MATTPKKKAATAKTPAAATKKASAAAKPAPAKPSAAAKKPAATTPKPASVAAAGKPAVDASRPIGEGPAWDGDPAKIPDYKADTDIVSAVISQFGLIRGVWGKIRAVGVIVLRLLP